MNDLEKLKQSHEKEFNDITDFTIKEISKWKNDFVSVNEE